MRLHAKYGQIFLWSVPFSRSDRASGLVSIGLNDAKNKSTDTSTRKAAVAHVRSLVMLFFFPNLNQLTSAY